MYTATVCFLPCYTAAISLKRVAGRSAPCPLLAISQRHDCDLICLTQREVNHPPPSVTFVGVAKASAFQVHRELPVWYIPELTLMGHG